MEEFYICRVGKHDEFSHFDKTFNKPIIRKEYRNIRWALNEKSIHKNKVKYINDFIKYDNTCWTILIPSAPNNYSYAICKLKEIKDRKQNLGPLINLDETNDERGWTESTWSGNNDYNWDFKFSEIYLLNENSFDGITVKGQATFFQLKEGGKNEELLKKIETEMKYIKRYIKPIIL